MANNVFQVILTDKILKKKLVDGFKTIYSSLYQNNKDRWISKQMNYQGKAFPIWGPGDLNESTGKYEWSNLNLVNTNYSALEKLRNYLYYDGVKIVFNKKPLENIVETIQTIDLFLSELEKRKTEYFLDGEVKTELISLINGTWGRGADHSTVLKNNFKKYFPTAISIDNKGDETGDVEDMLLGIDNTIFFENDVKITTQNKGCRKVIKVGNEYHIYCTVDYSKYNDKIVNYFTFFPSDENNKIFILLFSGNLQLYDSKKLNK